MMQNSFFKSSFGIGFDLGFIIIPIFIAIVFLAVLAVFIVAFVNGIRHWNKNNHAPRLTVAATVVTKRTDISHSSGHTNSSTGMHTSGHSYTDYYVTFQVDSGDRMEFHVTGEAYGLLAEGDFGELSFQGTRYLGFLRK